MPTENKEGWHYCILEEFSRRLHWTSPQEGPGLGCASEAWAPGGARGSLRSRRRGDRPYRRHGRDRGLRTLG